MTRKSNRVTLRVGNAVNDGTVSLSYKRWEELESHSALAYDSKPG